MPVLIPFTTGNIQRVVRIKTVIYSCYWQAVHRLQAGLPALLLRVQPPVGHGLLQIWVWSERPPPAHDHHGHGGPASLHGLLRRPLPLRASQQEAEAGEDNLHQGPAGHPRVPVPEDEVPGHLHEGGGRAQNQFARIQSSGRRNKSSGQDYGQGLCNKHNFLPVLGLVQEPSR